MSESAEREQLEALLDSGGWHWVTRYIRQEYDGALMDLITRVYEDPANANGMAEDKMRQLLAVRKHMLALIDWPKVRVEALKR